MGFISAFKGLVTKMTYMHTPYINSWACGSCFAGLRSLFSNLCQEHSVTFSLADSDLLEHLLMYRRDYE